MKWIAVLDHHRWRNAEVFYCAILHDESDISYMWKS